MYGIIIIVETSVLKKMITNVVSEQDGVEHNVILDPRSGAQPLHQLQSAATISLVTWRVVRTETHVMAVAAPAAHAPVVGADACRSGSTRSWPPAHPPLAPDSNA